MLPKFIYDIGETPSNIQIIKTDDGSDTLFNSDLKEVYHSKNGAMNESLHVFINAGYNFVSKKFNKINLLEIGFGTGLNALLTAIQSQSGKNCVEYFTCEPYPLNSSITAKLNYTAFTDKIGKYLWKKIQLCPWNTEKKINNFFTIHKTDSPIDSIPLKDLYYNLVYFDAFAPDIQPGLWTSEIFAQIYKSMIEGGVMVTYSAKGQVRRDLQSVGFEVYRIEGPKGKREMLRAVK